VHLDGLYELPRKREKLWTGETSVLLNTRMGFVQRKHLNYKNTVLDFHYS